MIFVSVGSRDYQFDRLVKELDSIVAKGELKGEVFAQIGQSNYEPKHFSYSRFLSHEDFSHYQDKADIIISHAGTGSLVGALKKGKRVIAVPRLEKFGEHIDDHQLQVAGVLQSENYLINVTDISELEEAISIMMHDNLEVKSYDKPSFVYAVVKEFLDDAI